MVSRGVLGAVGVALTGGAVLLASQGGGEPGALPQPCASPFSGAEAGRGISFPTDGTTRGVKAQVGENLLIGWSRCEEKGTWTTNDRRDEQGHLVGYASSSNARGKGDPDAKLYLVGYHVREAGVVRLTGEGDKGSHGTLVIEIAPGPGGVQAEPVLTAPPSRLKEAERQRPLAASCPPAQGPVVTLVLEQASARPACTAVNPTQRFRVVNRSGQDAVVTYGRYPPRTIRAGQTYTFTLQFGYQLACNVHDVPISIYGTLPEIWVSVC